MSMMIYIASDFLLEERVNPHDIRLSVNEALNMGIKTIPKFMLEEGFDRNRPNVLLYSDRDINIDLDTGVIDDGDFDDDFSVSLIEKTIELHTKKKYCACMDWVQYTPGRAKQFIEYLKMQLQNIQEIELWNTWLSGEAIHRIEKMKISIGELTAEDIANLEKQEVSKEPFTDYCYVITR